MAKIAAIDIGTNSTRLLITSFIHNKISTLKREMVITRLGKNIESTNSMQEDGIKKTIEALSGYLELCRQHKVEKIRAVGTSVFRRAGNRKYFLKRAYEKTGLKIDIISGQEEAKLCFEGVVKSLQYLDKTVSKIKYSFLRSKKESKKLIVLDIGGGSSELVFGKSDCSISNIKSIELGSVTISEKFLNADKAYPQDISLMNNHITEILKKELGDIDSYKDAIIIGVAGTVSTIGSIFLGMEKYEREKLNGLIISIEDIKNIFNQLSCLSLEDRKRVKGLQPERADIITGGTAILLAFLNYFGTARIMVSEHDILDGIIYSLCNF